jgi:hypothetical protein
MDEWGVHRRETGRRVQLLLLLLLLPATLMATIM